MFHVNCHLWTRISPSHPEVNSSLLTVMFYRSPSKSNLQRSVTYTNPPPRISLKSNVTWTNPSSSSTWPSSLKLSSYRKNYYQFIMHDVPCSPCLNKIRGDNDQGSSEEEQRCVHVTVVLGHQSPVFGGIYIYTHRQTHRPYHHFINLQSVTASALLSSQSSWMLTSMNDLFVLFLLFAHYVCNNLTEIRRWTCI